MNNLTNTALSAEGYDKIIAEFAEKERIMQERIWLDAQIGQFDEVLRLNYAKNTQDFAQTILQNICEQSRAYSGVFYLSNTEQSQVEAIAGYACVTSKLIQRIYTAGDGLVGQVIESKKLIFFNDIAPNAVHLKTDANVQLSAGSVLVIPLVFNEIAYGVLELFYIRFLEDKFVDLLKVFAKNIASTLESILNNTLTQKLLRESQEQAESLRSQEEEMRQNLEELQATQEEMHRKDIEIKGVFSAINITLATIEFDMEGYIITANDMFLNTMHYVKEEIIGKHHSIFLNNTYAQSSEYQTFWEKLRKGIPQTDDFKRLTKKGQEIWFRASYTPVQDSRGAFSKVIKLAQDITEKKLAEIETYRLSLVADNTDNSVIITDSQGIIEYVNAGFTRMTGYVLEEVVGKKPGSFLQGPETSKKTTQIIREKLQSRQAFYEEILNYNRDGETYWISLAINPVFNAKGELDKFVSIQANITETKIKALDFNCKLNAIEKSYGVVEFDTKGNILSANEIFLDLVGYSLEEVQGKHHRMFVSEDEKYSVSYQNFWNDLGIKGEFIVGEFCRTTKDGRVIWLKGSYNAIIDLQGRPYKVIKFALDITAEKGLEQINLKQTEELRSQEEELRQNLEELQATQEAMSKKQAEVLQVINRYEQILEGCIDAVITIDEKGSISFFNASAEKLFGYQREEVIGQNVKMLMPATHATSHDSYLHNYNTTRVAKVIGAGRSVEALTKNGQKKTILLTLSEARLETGHSIFTAFIKNLEEITSLQENLRAKEKQLTQTVQQYEQILEGCVDAVISINETGIISFFNASAEKLFGYQREEVIGQNVKMLMPTEHSTNHDTYLSNYGSTHIPKVIGSGRKVEALTKKGVKIPILLTLSEAKIDENTSVFTAFIKNLKEMRNL
jgi:PAS domain S-box-containing protein